MTNFSVTKNPAPKTDQQRNDKSASHEYEETKNTSKLNNEATKNASKEKTMANNNLLRYRRSTAEGFVQWKSSLMRRSG